MSSKEFSHDVILDALKNSSEMIIWMSGSDDFAIGGKARVGFEKMFRPTLDSIEVALNELDENY